MLNFKNLKVKNCITFEKSYFKSFYIIIGRSLYRVCARFIEKGCPD